MVSAYQQFVKAHYHDREFAGMAPKDVIKGVAMKWRKHKGGGMSAGGVSAGGYSGGGVSGGRARRGGGVSAGAMRRGGGVSGGGVGSTIGSIFDSIF